VDVVDLLILALRLLFVALLYLFLFAVLRLAISGLRAPTPAAEPGQVQSLRLQVIEPGESSLRSGQILEVADGMTLGRGDRADMVLGDTAISAEHVRISRVGRKWVVTDLGSTNGTRVNEGLVKVTGRAALAEGDVLGLGTVRLQVLPRGT
jgi:pSer/pThr/pTyr-binding forkhead associated (FHA) protein